MPNRIIKSLDCREIILIFCILQVDFTISVITLLVVFNESFQKALIDKSVCVINIVHLIVLSAAKNPLFDVYFNRIATLLAGLLSLVMRAYLSPFTLLTLVLVFFVFAHLSPFTLLTLVLVFIVFAKIFQIFRFSAFANISISIFHFYIKQKNK